MKVLFLDFSGTLNDGTYRDMEPRFDRANVRCVNRVTDATGAKIVISSDWVKVHSYETLREWLLAEGVTGEIIGHTVQPFTESTMLRPFHIQAWLREHPEVETYALVDDYRLPLGEHRQWWLARQLAQHLPPDVPGMVERFVLVDGRYGVTEEAADRLIAILGEHVG